MSFAAFRALDIVVKWVKPVYPFVKLNSDGSVGSNTAGMGGIIRNFKGDVIIAYASPLNHCKVIYAEMKGLAYWLEVCVRIGVTNFVIEVDALSLIQLLNNNIMCHPDFFYIMRKINTLMAGFNFNLIHIFREGSACADFLAKKGSLLDDVEEFSGSNIPQQLCGLVRLDKLGLLYIRSI
ncbi:Putative ribonuclease H protein [Dendrobium catenatum]|uniref:Ribonuclease H protein n=1 Tax=Dendrobium catenatum TaxID=906689 RepID=A0A2I0X6H4_9ASPA|nr:Putative ribonuclease H protein [Dendrobium catenatum]